jgi:hypothetical protein
MYSSAHNGLYLWKKFQCWKYFKYFTLDRTQSRKTTFDSLKIQTTMMTTLNDVKRTSERRKDSSETLSSRSSNQQIKFRKEIRTKIRTIDVLLLAGRSRPNSKFLSPIDFILKKIPNSFWKTIQTIIATHLLVDQNRVLKQGDLNLKILFFLLLSLHNVSKFLQLLLLQSCLPYLSLFYVSSFHISQGLNCFSIISINSLIHVI